MIMLDNTSSHFRDSVRISEIDKSFTLRLARFINGLIANVIAQRERQAQLTVLRGLNDRELMDIGINRCQIGEELPEADPKPDPCGGCQENRCRKDYAIQQRETSDPVATTTIHSKGWQSGANCRCTANGPGALRATSTEQATQ
jgi:uncharacterized protein YjiS (DUF1127 family)